MKRILFPITLLIIMVIITPVLAQDNTTKLIEENRELKAKLANQTKLINELKAENEFLREQINEYRQLLAKIMEEESRRAKESYIQAAAKKEKIGKIIFGALIVSGIFSLAILGFLKSTERKYKHYV
ncbi:hypothetical protein A3L04_06425 [Thermococcus chitonophagus]|uniref:Uncharacterized protein n=1 Tax=Thermococcus chitonophagus TaxID=54262 RepID=A0A160VTT8_9EURY|nr:hypothetical protein [Thermococcus chitonophagus]ASJ16733.1 hypothetical protein A3L04_06425 [Thermococcus chitonophagus]CUX78199.1 hypothetical protein, conserved, containing leucine zipper motif [Thermococcus chitonophagus]